MHSLKGKILGIIGGMGPMASQLLYQIIIEKTMASKDQDHIDMIILNHSSMEDRTEAILKNNRQIIIEKLIRDINFLLDSKVDHIVIPCNTTHSFLSEVLQGVDNSRAVVSIIDETAKNIFDKISDRPDNKILKIGIMATDGTIKMGLYEKALKNKAVEVLVPSCEMQKKTMSIIYDFVKKGEEPDIDDLMEVANHLFQRGCDYIILGCTELSLLKKSFKLDNRFLDPLEIVAEKLIEMCGRKVRK